MTIRRTTDKKSPSPYVGGGVGEGAEALVSPQDWGAGGAENSDLTILDLPIEVVRKDIKHLHLAVYPPDGRVRVAAPRRLDDETIRLAVVSRLGWIRRQQMRFALQDRQSVRELVTGESHYVQGRRVRIDVVAHDGPPKIELRNNSTLVLRLPPATDRERREALLNRWYRRQLRQQIPVLIARWEPVVGVQVADWRVKRMKTRWGACNIAARRIWLNLELAKKPPSCLEYILVHEMVHLLERRHNDRFRDLMDCFLPGWRLRREELNRAPLAHEDWDY